MNMSVGGEGEATGWEKIVAKKIKTRCKGKTGCCGHRGDILKSCYRGVASNDKVQHVTRSKWLICSRDEGMRNIDGKLTHTLMQHFY